MVDLHRCTCAALFCKPFDASSAFGDSDFGPVVVPNPTALNNRSSLVTKRLPKPRDVSRRNRKVTFRIDFDNLPATLWRSVLSNAVAFTAPAQWSYSRLTGNWPTTNLPGLLAAWS